MSSETPTKASVLSALSRALDLVEGQPEGHAQRTANIAVRIAQKLGLTAHQCEDLFFAALLKDAGCSNNSVRVQKIFGGDEHLIKHGVKFVDWSSTAESLRFSWQNTEAGQSLGAKLRRMASNLGSPTAVMNEVTKARCTRGSEIARMLGFSSDAADAILYLDEHWDGKGAPYRKSKLQIPLLARILCLAQTFEVFVTAYGWEEAQTMLTKRRKTWFDPEVVDVVRAMSVSELIGFGGDETFLPSMSALDSDLDNISKAFAMIIDAKSSFTSEHSTRVTQYSVEIAEEFGFDSNRITELRRGALLHDIGKLGVPTGILEKPGKLDETEFDRVKLHSLYGFEILSRIPVFEALAQIASSHHERLDGKGYWQGLSGEQISLDVRIVTVSDVFDALTADRPYRKGLPLDQVFDIMDRDAGTAFDHDCLAVLKQVRGGMDEFPMAA